MTNPLVPANHLLGIFVLIISTLHCLTRPVKIRFRTLKVARDLPRKMTRMLRGIFPRIGNPIVGDKSKIRGHPVDDTEVSPRDTASQLPQSMAAHATPVASLDTSRVRIVESPDPQEQYGGIYPRVPLACQLVPLAGGPLPT